MTAIDELLARALLCDNPNPRLDVVPPSDRDTGARDDGELPPWSAAETYGRYQTNPAITHDLHALCETVVAHTAATSLRDFITGNLPDPRGALVVGCILQLTDADDSSRFWWQYASGAGDNVATYCLYLHHLALGEHDAADWWHEQMRTESELTEQAVTLADGAGTSRAGAGIPTILRIDSSIPTVLRILRRLVSNWDRCPRPRTEAVNAVMRYVPGAVAVGYPDHRDLDLPLPGPHFAECLTALLAAATALDAPVTRPRLGTPRLVRRRTERPLPAQRPRTSRAPHAQSDDSTAGWGAAHAR
ncbi:hypothetical protein ACIHFE_30865 [Streptomyces sp. NPDC052396]|uniref:hypothetical protein n=1 Tax=Streptomyces sp. NPDC052396 TaxID=3365689 RepID=UPI0037D7BCB6